MDAKAQKQAVSLVRAMDLEYDDYKEVVAELLDHLDPTKLGPKPRLCDAIMRLWTTVAFEAMAFRLGNGGQLEVYLRRRAMDDTAYPGEWHAPGSLYRHGEQDLNVANRLEKEFGDKIDNFQFVGKEITNEVRGTVHSTIFLVQLVGDPRIDDRHDWFPVDNLPKVTVDLHEQLIIPKAVKAWWKNFLSNR